MLKSLLCCGAEPATVEPTNDPPVEPAKVKATGASGEAGDDGEVLWCADDYEANDPSEDRYFVDDANGIYGVLDGHGGFEVSEFSKTRLPELFLQHIREAVQKTTEGDDISEAIKEGIFSGYLEVDKQIMETFVMKDPFGKMAFVGACALTTWIHDGLIYVANVGDCRAVVGAMEGNSIKSRDLSVDQTTSNEDEIQMVKDRSGDDNAIRLSPLNTLLGSTNAPKRVAGILLVTRSLGDAYLKKSEFSLSSERSYITAEPVITTHTVTPTDRFLVLATDGLWEQFESQEVVEFVHKHGVNSSVSTALIDHMLHRIADRRGMSFDKLKSMPQTSRRNLHDDVTVVVVSLSKALDKSRKQPVVFSRASTNQADGAGAEDLET